MRKAFKYPQYGNGVRLEGERLILSKMVGAVAIVLHRPLEGTPKTVTLTRSRTGKWFACFACKTEAEPLPLTTARVGVDVGLTSFATLSDRGKKIDNPRFYRRDEADLKRVQQRKDAAKLAQDWPENAKQKGILAKIHARIANRRSDFAHHNGCQSGRSWATGDSGEPQEYDQDVFALRQTGGQDVAGSHAFLPLLRAGHGS